MTGYKNAALCALAYVKAIGLPVDETSFARVAGKIGDATDEQIAQGFIVTTYEDLERLCDIGGFLIASKDDLITAFMPEEWEVY